jgi:tetratricopeptide (TPR) repeat protein
LIGGSANDVSTEYGFWLFDRFHELPRTEQSVTQMELLELLARKDPRKAIQRLEKLRATLGRQPADWQYASIVYQRGGNEKEAFDCQRLATRGDRRCGAFKARLVELNINAGKRGHAWLGLFGLLFQRSDAAVSKSCAQLALRLGRYRLAITFARRLNALERSDQEAAILLARCYHGRKKYRRSHAIAAEIWLRGDERVVLSASGWEDMIMCLHNPEKPSLARAALKEGLRRFPGSKGLRDLETRQSFLRRFPAAIH